LIHWYDLSKEIDMRFVTWNIRGLYRAGSLKAAARELARYKLDLVGVQEVRWDKWEKARAGDYSFFYRRGSNNHQLGTGFFVHHRIEECRVFSSDRLSCMVLRGRLCNIIVQHVHVKSEKICDYSKGNFYEELEGHFYNFPEYHMKIC